MAEWQKIWISQCTSSQLKLCFSSHTANKCPVHDLFRAMLLCFVLVISLFKIAPEHRTEVVFSVSQCKKAVTCLTEKIYV